MKQKQVILALLALLISIFPSMAQTVAQADSAYAREHYQEALQLYSQIAQKQGVSSGLYYNMGNAYYRMNDLTHAIISYERALKLNPANADARANLDFVRTKAGISQDTGASFFTNLASGFVGRLGSNAWAWISVAAFLLMLGAVALYVFVDSVALRKVGFFGGGVLLVVFVLSLLFALHMHSVQAGSDAGIVTAPSATLSTVPHTPAQAEVAFTLKQGNKVAITDSVTSNRQVWLNVTTPDGRRAWLLSTDIERI